MFGSRLTATLAMLLALVGLEAVEAQEPSAAGVDITGIVFADLNGNGTHDEGEPGIADVRVSDQVTVVSTGADGRFRVRSEQSGDRHRIVFVSQPAGYRVTEPFWRRVAPDAEEDDLHFPLVQTVEPSEFTFIHASDPHLAEETLPRMQRLREIVVERNPAFVLITGDLISDALRVGEGVATGLYELLVQELGTFPVPVWNALGNHEIFGIERHHSLVSSEHPLYGKEMFRRYLGPNYYSFDFGGVRFICLDTVDYDDLWYHGYVDAVQLAWLREDLESVEPDTRVVTFNHIPLLTSGEVLWGYSDEGEASSLITVDGQTRYRHVVSNPRDVLAELRQHQFTLALAGHFHMREQLSFETEGVKTRFHQTSSIRGDLQDAAGMRMISGVTLYRVTDGEIDDGTFIPLD